MPWLKEGNLTVQWLLHSGQTGVARGAYWAGAGAIPGLKSAGISPMDMTDERGIIPGEVRDRMRACDTRGTRQQYKELVLLSNAVLVVSNNRLVPSVLPEIDDVLQYVQTRAGHQVMMAGPGDGDAVYEWLVHMPMFARGIGSSRNGDFSLLVVGPRASVWPDGEQITLDILVKAFIREGVK